MNPAVTLAFAVTRRLAWKKVPVYWAAQLVGSFVASACVYGVYYGKSTTLLEWFLYAIFVPKQPSNHNRSS